MNPEILNAGLHMALEFGPNLNQPIHQRLKDQFAELSDTDLEDANQLCYRVRDEGVNFIFSSLEKVASRKETIAAAKLELLLQDCMAKYLWISSENMGRIFSQGCYYAWKDGLIEAMQG